MAKYQIGSTNLVTQGPAVTRDFAFKSDMSKGVLYYESPSVKGLLGDTLGSKISSLTTELYIQGPLVDGASAFFKCDTSTQCSVNYSMTKTPQVNRIYPSVAYPTQPICFNVFIDYAASDSKNYYVSSNIGGYSMSFSMYDSDNQLVASTWNDFQICAQAPAATAKNSYDVSIISQDGAYLFTNFAKSYDGTNPFTVKMIPEIVSVSSNTLYKASGGILTISGFGFDLTPSNNLVMVDDVSCAVFESTDTQIRCVLGEKQTTTSATTFVGGSGARVKEYYGLRKSSVTDSSTPTKTKYYTDIESRRNDDTNDPQYTRIIESWFVPPQTGGYIFFASCDDSCIVELSTSDMDKTSKSTILSVGLNSWRNIWDPSPTSFYSSEQTLQAGKHYYMKVTHEEISGDDYVTVGFKINDSSAAKPNSLKGWKTLYIEPHHTFEKFEVLLPNNPSASFRIQFTNTALKCVSLTKSSDIFTCTSTLCPCVSGTFTTASTESQFLSAIYSFFNQVQSYYGSTMTITKQAFDSSGAVTTDTASIVNYKFIFEAKYVLSSESSSLTTIWSDTTGITATVSKTQSSSTPLSGKYAIKIPLSDGSIVTTEDISLDIYNGQITRYIYNVAPEYIGRLELKVSYKKYPTSKEGKELYYRIDQGASINLQIASSTTSPLTGGSTTTSIECLSNNDAILASNTPFYEVIPGTMVRSVESKPQIIVTSNGLVGACPTSSACDVNFVTDVGQITSRTAVSPYTEMSFVGTSIPSSELTYVSVGTVRRCDLDPNTPPTSTSIKCLIGNMISGSHSIVVQSTKGAIKNSSTLGNLNVEITITSVSPSTLSQSGGQTLTITGQFFPVSLQEANSFSDFSVKFTGGSKCTVTSVSSTSIVCITPKGLSNSSKVTVAFNGKSLEYSTAFTINQSSQQVISIDKTTICPVLKQDIVITVSSTPSSNPNDYTGIIVNDSKSIYMRINKVDTSAKTLTARFPGSPKNDDYTVFVEYNGDRYQSAVTLSAKSTITSIQITTPGSSKTSISTTGGDTITIIGTGFSTTLGDNLVVLGDNTYAEMISATSTQLVSRAGSYKNSDTLEFKVFLKLSIESTCAVSGGCKLIYDNTQAPSLTSDTLIPVNGVITINGNGFGSNPVGYIGTYPQQTISSSSTQIVLKLIKMNDNEAFSLLVKTDSIYLSQLNVQVPLNPALLGVTPHTGSIGGEKLILSATGIGISVNSNFNVFYTSGGASISICDTITLIDSSNISCVTKRNLSIPSTTLSVSFTHKSSQAGTTSTVTLSCTTASDCAYQTSSSATPTISSLSQINSGLGLQATINNFSFDSSYKISIYYGSLAASSTSIISSTVVSGTFTNGLPPGVVQVSVSFEKDNRLTFTSGYQQSISLSATINSPVTCSWAGGCVLEITQNSITQGATAGDISVQVCGQTAKLDLSSSTSNTLKAIVPVYATSHSLDLFKVQQSAVIKGTVTSLPVDIGALAFDGITSTMFISASTDNCYVQVKFDDGKIGRVTSIKYYMNRMSDKQTNFVDKLKFQSSSDGSTWVDVFAVDKYLREGWNTYTPTSAIEVQYYRFFSATKSACQIGEIQLYGNIVESTTSTSKVCDVIVNAPGGQTKTFTSQVTYADTASSVVTSITPRYGTYKGGETVTFAGTGFSSTSSEISVIIDGINCAVSSATSTQIQCITGARPTVNSSPSTIVKFSGSTKNGYASMQNLSYKYTNYWSDLDTWGGEYLPKDGDSVLIPAGQSLVVDIDKSPILKAVVIEGSLIFSPNSDPNHQRTFDAEYIYVSTGAFFEAGTEANRYTSKLTITMHGTKESAQLPTYGNKGIFVRFGTFDLHGVARDYTWTELATTVEKGKNQIVLNVKTDWKVGEEIVIAPTDFDRDHAEVFKITGVDNTGTKSILTLNTTTTYKHYSGLTTFTANNANNSPMTKSLEMRAEVGLLTRNVVYKGADDDSIANRYGAHIMLHSPGDNSLTGRISYSEFYQVGQAFQLGRYPIHFHMIGRVDNSYIKGNAIHHTYNRACTIHGVHYLTIENNVAFETMGHTFFIEDAAETKNLLKNNLAIKTKISWSLLNTDQTPASFWITHPDNMFIGNHAAGADKYGFWFDLKDHPTGPSYTPNVCPQYEQLGEFTGNVAHSNGRYGLRIFHRFTPVTNPCQALAGGAFSNYEQPDPTVSVPIVTHFRDFLAYKNMRTGIIAEELGALKFHNIRTADHVFSGVEFGITAVGPWLSTTDDYHLQDALIVGASENYETESQYPGVDDEVAFESSTYCGIKGARTEKMRIKNVLFANFQDPTWAAIATCSHCEGPGTDSAGRTYFFKNLFFSNVARKVGFDTPFKEIIYDEDGTLGNSTHRWVVHYFNHLDVPECIRDETQYNGLLCNKDISIRRIVFDHPEPENALKGQPIKIMNTKLIPTSRRNLVDISPATCPSTSNTLSTISTWDTTSFTTQQSLLQKYSQYGQASITYKTNLDLAELTNSQTAAQTAATAKTTMDSLVPEINTLENDLKQYLGKYDDLYKSDVKFCNTNNYQNIDFRAKRNPMKNLVFPVITGYEYHVSLANGQDFTKLNGQYSYKELLNGETAGVILHFNHTERTEAFYLNYTDSTTSKVTSVPFKTSLLSLSDTSIKNGDMYMNNVTRHMMIKFDGQNSDRNTFTLERFECITFGGCNNQNVPNEGKIETGYRYWSDPKSWATTTGATGVIPKAGDDVIIQSTWNMVLDLTDPPVFRSIEINGRLTIQNDGKTYNLQSYLIYVRKGELIVGTSDKPITGKVIFTLHGSRADKDVYFNDKMFEAGNKVIANTGLLNMYGKHITTKWTRLAQTAPSGQNWILLVDSPTDWTVGDELGINPSGRDYTQRDFAVIQSISGNNVTLSSPLVYTHYGASSIDSTKTGGIDIRAEVLHLTRNIVVKGTNVDRWGGHVVTAHNNDSGFVDGKLVTIQRKGYAIIDHVEFVNCSQYDTDKASVRFANFFALTDSDIQSSVSNSAIHNGLGIGIMVTSADNVLVNGNVVFFHHIGGVWLKKSNKVTITNNVAGGMGTRYWSEETKLDELAVFNICNNDQICKNLVIKNNIVGGSERIGYLLPTTSCTESSPSYENNLAHSVQHGAWILKNNLITGCQAFRNFKAYKTMEQGVLTYQGYNELEVSNIETLDCGRGVTLNIGGLFDINNIRFKDSTIWGQTNLLPEDKGQFCVESYGFWIPQATLKGKVVPESMLSHLPYEKVISYANWFAEVRVSNIKFKNWDSAFRSCSASTLHRVFGINSDASDGVPVTYLDQIEFINVHNDAVVYLFTPPQKWAIVRDCGQFPCTGPLNTALKFTNTIASGSPVPNIYSITSSQIAFQIIPNNIGASENIDTCSLVSTWNSYLCKNDKIAQLMFESKDSDAETRTFSPINILDQNSKFNSTLNNFMDHCWDGHYTCQFRLSRFPSLIQTNRYYEIKFTGTQPANTRYTIAGGQTGVDWLHLKIDFSQSRLFNLYANGVLVKANDFDPKTNQLTPIQKLKCGENVYYKPTFIYEFYLTYGCTVKFEGVDYVEAMVRLQISYNDFFSSIGSTKFIDKFASVLGITQDTIRIVSVYEGSTVVYFAVTSPTSSGSSATTSALTSINDKLNYQCSNGNLDLGAPLLACSSQLVSSTGTVTSTGSGNYKKKEISNVVYVILAFAVFATAAAILIGSIKAIKITRSYKEITNLEISYEKGNAKSEFADQIDIKKENP